MIPGCARGSTGFRATRRCAPKALTISRSASGARRTIPPVRGLRLHAETQRRPIRGSLAAGIDHLVAGIPMAHKDDGARLERSAAVFDDLCEYFKRKRG